MRRRILLAIGGTLLVMLIIISLSSSALLRDSYAGLERRYMERDVQRITSDIARQETVLGRTVEDYATLEGLYQFVLHPASGFARTTFTPEGAANLRLDVVVVFNRAGSIVYRRSYGTPADEGGIAESLSAWIAAHPGRVGSAGQNGNTEGVVGLPQGTLILVSRPIVDDLHSRPVAGTLVMGRLLDAEEVRQMGSRLLVAAEVYSLNAAVPESARRAQEHLTPENPVFIDTTRDRIASVYSLLRDVVGDPVAIVQVDSPRDIRLQGERTVRFFFIWLYFVGAGFFVVVILTIERAVLSRLMHLGRSVLAIGTGGDPTKRIAIAGRDQIAYLSAAINGMLDAQ